MLDALIGGFFGVLGAFLGVFSICWGIAAIYGARDALRRRKRQARIRNAQRQGALNAR